MVEELKRIESELEDINVFDLLRDYKSLILLREDREIMEEYGFFIDGLIERIQQRIVLQFLQ